MSYFREEIFLGDLNVNFNEAELNNNMPIDNYNEKFYNTFKQVIDKYAPLRRATRKEKQLHAKLWLTCGLLKSINHKSNFFKKNFTKTAMKSYLNTTKTIAIC